jgi:hypothetical protein
MMQKEVKLNSLVTGDAGIGSSALSIFNAEVIHDTGLELWLKVDRVKRNVEGLANSAGIIHVLDRAAGRASGRTAMPFFTP